MNEKTRIYENVDCMEGMKKHEQLLRNRKVLAVVDPPYGFGDAKTNILNFRQKEQHRNWNVKPTQEYFDSLFSVSIHQIVWGGNYFSYLWQFGGRCFIYWHKGNPVSNFADGELAWTNFNRNAKQFDYRYYGNLEGGTITSVKFHPTQKPVKLYKWILENYAKDHDLILDTHVGSGSSLIACEEFGIDYIGFELDPEYYEQSKQRIERARFEREAKSAPECVVDGLGLFSATG